MKSHYNTFAETEALLLAAIRLPGIRIKDLAAATNIKVNTLYKWKSGCTHLSPQKADSLLLYFIHNEPDRLAAAESLAAAPKTNTKTNNYPVLSSDYRCGNTE